MDRFMKEEWAKPEYANDTCLYRHGDDVADKSYRETEGLLKAFPNLKSIIAPTSVIVAPPRPLKTRALLKIFVSGLGLPSE
jgi:rhamnose transport system substrate-binding protein